ncbi:unnamed protein product [Eruca vesicaria subsp. sativa]|uniref:Uncharacterized protein n=1 Tax=Eruca vesicaria subsp. sativa TaxID=29727 RepID=A0ABC8KCI8_ERUVS|nr:unnamed protein product [Eruca vesicaria subsp. sativa]
MHASSYWRDCTRDWMFDSASGYYYNHTNDLGCGFNYSDSIELYSISFFVWVYTDKEKGSWVTKDEAYSAIKENVARGNQVKRA